MNQLFLDKSHQQAFDTEGFVVADVVFNETELLKIQSDISQYTHPIRSDIFFSLLENNGSQNKKIATLLFPYFKIVAQNYFGEFRINTPSFLIKPAKTLQELFLHQDWSYTDETLWQTATVWIPLIDTDNQNGGLFVIPRSHLFFNNYRSSSLPTARQPLTTALLPYVEQLNVKAGQAVFFHPSLFHGSFPNASNKDRISITSIVLPTTAPFMHYTNSDEKDIINEYAMDEDSFIESLADLTQRNYKNKMKLVRSFCHHQFQPIENDLLQKLRNV